MTISDLAVYLQMSQSSLYKLVQRGSVPGHKVGRHWRFHKRFDRIKAIVEDGELVVTGEKDCFSPDTCHSAALASDESLFDVPDGLIRIFDRDLVFAGLARVENRGGKEVVIKTDDRGRTIDVHALRHTFGTHLSKAGVPLRTAQAAMRHSDPSLTANVYTDPKLLDVAGAVASLPDLPLAAVGGPAVAAAMS